MVARIYGGKWCNLGSLGEGAQGHVFKVRNTTEQNGPIYALKRLKKESRAERFLQEIEALKKIAHPNVMRILDYSNVASPDDDGFDYYFVMPNAENGNLKKRVGLYKENLDGVISVAFGLCAAIGASHALGYIHRDVKPENILFNSLDHHPWLSDFGICHDRHRERLTLEGDVMGPRGFTAPELESGEYGDVDPSCDIYSLGKVIYYMITGGNLIGREHFGAEFHRLAEKGERYSLLQILLSRMIAPIENRIKDVQEVASELARIRDWENSAKELALSPHILAKIDKQMQNSINIARITAENEKVQSNTNLLLDTTAKSICAWLAAELEKLKGLMSRSGTYSLQVQDATWAGTHYFGTDDYLALSGVEFMFTNNTDIFRTNNVLKFFVCKRTQRRISVGNHVQPLKPVDPRMALIPYFLEYNDQQRPFQSGMHGFVRSKTALARSQQELIQRTGRRLGFSDEPLIAKTFVGPPINLIVEFRASEWPAVVEQIRSVFSEAVGAAIDHTTGSFRSAGP